MTYFRGAVWRDEECFARDGTSCRCGMGAVEFKPRDLGSDRGYRVALETTVVVVWVWGEFETKPAPSNI